jgi:hypothetical protein
VLRWQNSTSAPFAIVAKSSLAGVAFADAVAVVGNECFFVGKGPQGMLGVFAVDENCNIRKVSTNAVDQRLAKYAAITHGFKDISSFTYTYKGHQFFIFTAVEYYDEFEGTMAYDVGEDVWTDRASFDENGDKFAWCAVDAHHIEGRPTFVTKTRGGKYRLAEFVPNSSTDHWLEETSDDLNYYIVKERSCQGVLVHLQASKNASYANRMNNVRFAGFTTLFLMCICCQNIRTANKLQLLIV